MSQDLRALTVASAAVLWGTADTSVALSKGSGLTHLQAAHTMLLSSSCFLLVFLRDCVRRLNPYLILYGLLVIAPFGMLYVISISVNEVELTSTPVYGSNNSRSEQVIDSREASRAVDLIMSTSFS